MTPAQRWLSKTSILEKVQGFKDAVAVVKGTLLFLLL